MTERDRINEIPPTTPQTERERRENEMRQSFYKQYQEILAHPEKYVKRQEVVKIGLELEFSLLGYGFGQVTQEKRDAIIEKLNASDPNLGTFADVELGASQMEVKTKPVDILKEGVASLYQEVDGKVRLTRIEANKLKAFLLSCGSNPFIPVTDIQRTKKEKYAQVPSFHNDNKRRGLNTVIGSKESVDVQDAAIIGLCNAMQVNLEARDFEDAIDKLNRSLMFVPYSMSLGNNARFLDSKDTGLAEFRMKAWEISHDTRTLDEFDRKILTRVGHTNLYYRDLKDYFQRMTGYPFILYSPPNALAIGIGLNWRDVRVKFIEDSVVVEFRPVSIQPSAEENIAMSLFYVGRLAWSQKTEEPLLDLTKVGENRNTAIEKGFGGEMWVYENGEVVKLPTADALKKQLEKAREGLLLLGIEEKQFKEYFEILEERLKTGSLSDKLAEKFYKLRQRGYARKEALFLALWELRELS